MTMEDRPLTSSSAKHPRPPPSAGGGRPPAALSLSWCLGMSTNVVDSVHSLSGGNRDAILYVAANTAIIFDRKSRAQKLLQGHFNAITAVSVSQNKRFAVTVDAGPDSMLVVWDTRTASPVKTVFNPHSNGCYAVDFSPDGMLVATLGMPGEQGNQEVAVWEWTKPGVDRPLHTSEIASEGGPGISPFQRKIKFNPSDVQQLMTCGGGTTMFWSWEAGSLEGYALSPRRKGGEEQTACLFLPGTTQAVTATSAGEVMLWDSVDGAQIMHGVDDPEKMGSKVHSARKKVTKILALSPGSAIRHMSIVSRGLHGKSEDSLAGSLGTSTTGGGDIRASGSYLVIAGEDGAVRFFDFQFRIEAWFEDIDAGPVLSVSFDARPQRESDVALTSFHAPDFLVGTQLACAISLRSALFEETDPKMRRGEPVIQGIAEEVVCIASHPMEPLVAILCISGELRIWDHDLKLFVSSTTFEGKGLQYPRCCTYHPQGDLLSIGFASGACKLLNSVTLQEVAAFRWCTSSALFMIRFSGDGQYMAAADADFHVLLWSSAASSSSPSASADEQEGDEVAGKNSADSTSEAWEYIGRHKSHTKLITGIEFGVRQDGSVGLASIGEDCRLVLYDVLRSSPAKGLLLLSDNPTTSLPSTPTAVMWHPTSLDEFVEDRLVIANNEYKLTQWNAANMACRRTSLGPLFGSAVTSLIPVTGPGNLIAYATPERVVGVMKLPLDGDPVKVMGLIAHPGQLASIAVSSDGNTLFTSGGRDLTMNAWSIQGDSLSPPDQAEEPQIRRFIDQLEGGEGGELHEELVDYFYYAQLKVQGVNSTEPRNITGRVPVEEIPNLMRALGYYPSEAEVQGMIDEIRYDRYTVTGEIMESVDLDGFIKLFVNHRPIFPVGKGSIENAFETLAEAEDLGLNEEGVAEIDWTSICDAVTTAGEVMPEGELKHCLKMLTGEQSLESVGDLDTLTARDFAKCVLGFEDDEDRGLDERPTQQ
jgi:WD40 repeat protein/Ca2+-binding EF-hand superfamily protein